MSGDIFECNISGEMTTGIKRLEARDAVKHLFSRQSTTAKNYLVLNVTSAKVKKPWSREMRSQLPHPTSSPSSLVGNKTTVFRVLCTSEILLITYLQCQWNTLSFLLFLSSFLII